MLNLQEPPLIQAYVDFLKLCLEHPDLDVFETPVTTEYHPDASQLRHEHAIFAVLISLFEKVHYLFEVQGQGIQQRQKYGWYLFMKSYAGRPNFRSVWDKIGIQFDLEFQEFFNTEIIRSLERAGGAPSEPAKPHKPASSPKSRRRTPSGPPLQGEGVRGSSG